MIRGVGQIIRRGYHHGDLANALVDEASTLARQGGPEAVVLREAARRAGVSATAAYRHFTDQRDLLHSVKQRAQDRLVTAMETEIAASAPLADPVAEGYRRLRALGTAYIDFALAEPGLFRTAFCKTRITETLAKDPFSGRAYALLSETLDQLAACGAIPQERRPHLETATWAAVHGIATLLIDGLLSGLSDEERRAVIECTMAVTIAGIAQG
jgi:AcrR family transcriptional regulator